MWVAVSGVLLLLLLPPPCASRLCITSSGCAAGLYKRRRREVVEEEEEERGGYVRYRVLPPEWAPRIHMIPSLLRLNYFQNCFLLFRYCLEDRNPKTF